MNRELWEDYLNYDARTDLKAFQTIPAERWMELGEQQALATFRDAAQRVPAYRDFLATNGVKPESVRTIEDFRHLPLTDKKNYLDTYTLNDIANNGTLQGSTVIWSSSGSSGEPHYWPRTPLQDASVYKGVELLLIQYFDVDRFSTLVINCLPMGTWTAGEIMHSSVKAMGDKGLSIAVISPGLDVDRFFEILNDLGKNFEKVIACAYPSLFSLLATEAERRELDFRDMRIGFVTGGEGFSEGWRRRMASVFRFRHPYRSIASVLGTSETGLTGFSTPLVDSVRMHLFEQTGLANSLFGGGELPSIIQFVPPARFVEIINRQIVVTCTGLVPLIRYNTHDLGQIFMPQELLASLPGFREQYHSLGEPHGMPNLPVLTVEGRADALTILAVNIFHNQLCSCIEAPELAEFLTGRFVAEEIETETAEKHLQLMIELRSGVDHHEGLANEVTRLIATNLAALNSEYAVALSTLGESVHPLVELVPAGSSNFLSSGKGSAIRRRPTGQKKSH